MNKLVASALLVVLFAPVIGQAADEYVDFQRAVAAGIASGELDGTVKFYYRGQTPVGEIKEVFPEEKTRKNFRLEQKGHFAAPLKSNESDCSLALRHVLMTFQNTTKSWGGNAVIDMVSYHEQKRSENSEKVICYYDDGRNFVQMRGKPAIVE
jgi:hypothetical protein